MIKPGFWRAQRPPLLLSKTERKKAALGQAELLKGFPAAPQLHCPAGAKMPARPCPDTTQGQGTLPQLEEAPEGAGSVLEGQKCLLVPLCPSLSLPWSLELPACIWLVVNAGFGGSNTRKKMLQVCEERPCRLSPLHQIHSGPPRAALCCFIPAQSLVCTSVPSVWSLPVPLVPHQG